MPTNLTPPDSEEYAPLYSGYIERAQARGDVFTALSQQIEEIRADLDNLTDEQGVLREAPNEWSIKEVLGHLNDVERDFSYRLLRVSRNDITALPGFEQNNYVTEAGFDDYPLNDLIHEFEYLRRANILAIRNMSEEAILRRGTASGYTVSARALIYMIVGHVDQHLA